MVGREPSMRPRDMVLLASESDNCTVEMGGSRVGIVELA